MMPSLSAEAGRAPSFRGARTAGLTESAPKPTVATAAPSRTAAPRAAFTMIARMVVALSYGGVAAEEIPFPILARAAGGAPPRIDLTGATRPARPEPLPMGSPYTGRH